MADLIIDEDDFRRACTIVHHAGGGAPLTDYDRKVIDVMAQAIGAERARTLKPFRELFAGGPDTVCRTTWQHGPSIGGVAESIECVEVPMDELRAAFDAAEHGR